MKWNQLPGVITFWYISLYKKKNKKSISHFESKVWVMECEQYFSFMRNWCFVVGDAFLIAQQKMLNFIPKESKTFGWKAFRRMKFDKKVFERNIRWKHSKEKFEGKIHLEERILRRKKAYF